MAERRPPSALRLAAVPCLVAWFDTEDGLARHLYRRDEDPTLQVALDLEWADETQDEAQSTGRGGGGGGGGGGGTFSSRLRVPVDLKACPHVKTPLFLYIRPECIASVSSPSTVPPVDGETRADADNLDTLQSAALVRAKFGPRFVRLNFVLHADALPDMVVPCGVPIVPTKRRPHGEQISLLARLARARSFSIFLKDDGSLSPPLLRRLTDALSDSDPAGRRRGEGRSTPPAAGAPGGMSSLYSGRGAKILDSDGLSAILGRAVPPLSLPPPYETLEAPPPPAPLDHEVKDKASSSSSSSSSATGHRRKRHRGDDGDRGDTGGDGNSNANDNNNKNTCCSNADCRHVSAAQFEQFRHEVNEALHQLRQQHNHSLVTGHVAGFVTELVASKIEAVRSEIMAEVHNNKAEVMGEIARRADDLQLELNDVVRDVGDVEDRVDTHVEDAILDYKVELEEKSDAFQSDMEQLVTEQLDRLQESVLDSVTETVLERLSGTTVTVEQAVVRLHGLGSYSTSQPDNNQPTN